jgi:hypothetical protein
LIRPESTNALSIVSIIKPTSTPVTTVTKPFTASGMANNNYLTILN